MKGRSRLSLAGRSLAPLALAACLSVQDYGGVASSAAEAGADVDPRDDGSAPSLGDASSTSATFAWQWINPAPTGRTLHAIGGVSGESIRTMPGSSPTTARTRA